MPISFEHLRKKLLTRVTTLDKAFERHVLSPSATKAVDRFALQEGLVSALWQAWCEFCRGAIMGATRGANTTSGVAVNSPTYNGNSELEIAYVAQLLSQSKMVTKIKSVKGRHQEPTWGDVGKVNLIVSGLAPTNSGTMLSGFGGVISLKDLQTCRNASAHVCSDTFAMVRAARVRYQDTDFKHPSDVMKWIDPATKDYLWRSWVEEMDIVSDLVTQ
ncbi:hypothetical protein ACTJK5_09600 [Agrobacterium sp. 22094]|uniref:hypothetical protein n=1 Tax=Agrobacterium sp. 22094 TaxID=3453872 RepID=UPI003F82F7F1